MIRIGLLGCGFMGKMHAACYQALADMDVRVAAVADTRPEFGRALAEQYGAEVFDDAMALVQSDVVDVVDICLPTFLHTRYAVAAMRTGKDVFIEKPVCILEDEMKLLLETEKQTGRKVQVGQVLRFWEEYTWLKKAVQEQTYGRFLSGTFWRLSAAPTWSQGDWYHKPELSGGLVVDMHVHDVDFVRYLLGEPAHLQARAQRDGHGLIQQIFSLYSYGPDVAVSIEASWDHPQSFPFSGAYRVRFERAAAVYENGVLRVYPDTGEPFTPEFSFDCQQTQTAGGNIASLGGYYNELKFFIEGLKGQHPLDVATVEESIASVRLVQREIAAAGGLIIQQ